MRRRALPASALSALLRKEPAILLPAWRCAVCGHARSSKIHRAHMRHAPRAPSR